MSSLPVLSSLPVSTPTSSQAPALLAGALATTPLSAAASSQESGGAAREKNSPWAADEASALIQLCTLLRQAGVAAAVTLHAQRRIALRLAGRPGAWQVGVHHLLLEDADFCRVLPAWIAAGGRGRHPGIRASLRRLGERLPPPVQRALPPLPDLPTLDGPLDLVAAYRAIAERYFADLRPGAPGFPRIGFARVTRGPVRQIRYGTYRRAQSATFMAPARAATITLHPRLDQPFVARVFVDHVLFHELCHHRQAMLPLRRETMHSPRFRAWERSFPGHAEACLWERHHRQRLLRGSESA